MCKTKHGSRPPPTYILMGDTAHEGNNYINTCKTVVNKSYIRTPKPAEQIKVECNVAMVKDLLEENVNGHVIYFCGEAARIAK